MFGIIIFLIAIFWTLSDIYPGSYKER
jgi:hypothetical protein